MTRFCRCLCICLLFIVLLGFPSGAQEPEATPEALTPASVGNMEYRCGLESPIPLRNGLYAEERPYLPGRTLTLSANLAGLAHGDLDGDQIPEAAVVYIHNSGGTDYHYMLSILEATPQGPREIDCLHLGDRVQLQDVRIRKGQVLLDMVSHGPKDPPCCPEKVETWGFVLRDRRLGLAPTP